MAAGLALLTRCLGAAWGLLVVLLWIAPTRQLEHRTLAHATRTPENWRAHGACGCATSKPLRWRP
eukprot:5803700-Lingulodinium_polyedra.AAC.1